MLSLLTYAKTYKKELILGPFFKLLEAILELLLPLYMAKLIDEGIKSGDTQQTIKMAMMMLFMSLIGLVCVIICQYYAARASQGFGTELRHHLMKKINALSHSELDAYGTSTLITRMTNDINQLQLALAMLIRLVIRAPFLSIGSIIMAFYIDTTMGIIFIITIPIFSLILWVIMKKTVPLFKRVQQKIDALNETLKETLQGVRVIRSFSKQPQSEKVFDTVSDDLATSYQNVSNLSALLSPITGLIMNGAIIFILSVGSFQVNTGHLSSGEVVALINYMTQMLLALIVVSNLVVIFTKAFASASRVEEMLETQPDIVTTEKEVDGPWENTPLVSFNNVSFQYPLSRGYALKQINFQLKKGETLGIIGPTGSGKTTIAELINRSYDISNGEMTLNGIASFDYPTGKLRQHLGIVPQKSTLFSGTIRSNLLMGNPDATEEMCYSALELAQCLEFVTALPEKLDAPVLANGNNFSGGQKQRLCLARAIIKSPDLLLLDDSLSALDYQTDWLIRKQLRSVLPDMTTIIISQRLSSIKQADHILVLDNGKQVGLGTHDELMKSSDIYQQIAAAQDEKEVH